MKCQYCKQWNLSKYREAPRRETEKSKVLPIPSDRFCSKNQKMVKYGTNMCKMFEPHPFFWCRFSQQWLDLNVCSSRKSRGEEGCPRCSTQYREVLEVRKILGRMKMKLVEPQKPVLVKRKTI